MLALVVLILVMCGPGLILAVAHLVVLILVMCGPGLILAVAHLVVLLPLVAVLVAGIRGRGCNRQAL